MMNTPKGQKYFGSCLMDFTTLDDVIQCLDLCCSNYKWYWEKNYYYDTFEHQIGKQHGMRCLINFVEALVTQEKIYVPFLSAGGFLGQKLTEMPHLGFHRKLPNFFKDLYRNRIVDELRVDKKISDSLKSAYEEYATSEAFGRKFSGSIRNIDKLYTYDELLRISRSSSGNPFFKWNEFIKEPNFELVFYDLEQRLATGKFRFLLEGDPIPLIFRLGKFVLRGLAYNDISKIEGVPYIPHPLRAIFSMSESLWSCNKTREWGTIAINYMNSFRDEYVTNLGTNIIEVDIPFIFSSIIRMSKRREDIIPVALQLRDTKSAQAFREWNREITEAMSNNDGRKVLKALREIASLKKLMRKELDCETDKFTANLWIISYDIKIPPFLHAISAQLLGKKHIQFLHDYANRSLSIMSFKSELSRVFYE